MYIECTKKIENEELSLTIFRRKCGPSPIQNRFFFGLIKTSYKFKPYIPSSSSDLLLLLRSLLLRSAAAAPIFYFSCCDLHSSSSSSPSQSYPHALSLIRIPLLYSRIRAPNLTLECKSVLLCWVQEHIQRFVQLSINYNGTLPVYQSSFEMFIRQS